MKYRFLYKILRALIYTKRAVWWLGAGFAALLAGALFWIIRPLVSLKIKIKYWLKKLGLTGGVAWFARRGFLQAVIFGLLFNLVLPHTNILAKPDSLTAGSKSIAFKLVNSDEVNMVEEVTAGAAEAPAVPSAWRSGALSAGTAAPNAERPLPDFTAPLAGGTALGKPILLPGQSIVSQAPRAAVVNYVVQIGDSLSTIAEEFNVSVFTILWENGLRSTSIIQPGQTLKIPPVSGVMHTVKKGDTLTKIAKLYGASADDIVKFNNLNPAGTNLIIGSRIMVPGGKLATFTAPSSAPSTARTTASPYDFQAAPPSSLSSPSASGFIWPSGAHYITQYFSWKHHAIDIAGPWQTPTYAAKSGVVEKAQCGWNSGYGCEIIIDHGGGIKTLYGHSSVLLVTPGQYVTTGQTIALMGNTGNVRGITGIHLHFEVIVNGVRVNPLGYVK